MSHYIGNCVFFQENNEFVIPAKEPRPTQCRDPLDSLDIVVEEPKAYRVNCAVFAEPFDITGSLGISHEDSTEDSNKFEIVNTTKIENVSIVKRRGKGKEYNISMDESEIICPQQQCKKSFLTTTLFKAHIRKIHCSDKLFVCEQCGASFKAQYLLNRHYLVHSKEKVQCPVCYKMLSLRTNMRLHLRSHAGTRPHECSVCHKRFLRRSAMNVHVSSVHKTTVKDRDR